MIEISDIVSENHCELLRMIQAVRIIFSGRTDEDATLLLKMCDKHEKHIMDMRLLRLNKTIPCGDSRNI